MLSMGTTEDVHREQHLCSSVQGRDAIADQEEAVTLAMAMTSQAEAHVSKLEKELMSERVARAEAEERAKLLQEELRRHRGTEESVAHEMLALEEAVCMAMDALCKVDERLKEVAGTAFRGVLQADTSSRDISEVLASCQATIRVLEQRLLACSQTATFASDRSGISFKSAPTDTKDKDGLSSYEHKKASSIVEGESVRRSSAFIVASTVCLAHNDCAMTFEDFKAFDKGNWEEDASNCSICSLPLGKRYFRRRHHCRSCGKCVCSKCSPNSVALPHLQGVQRVCNPCIQSPHRMWGSTL
jgi:hypothetical protein